MDGGNTIYMLVEVAIPLVLVSCESRCSIGKSKYNRADSAGYKN
jgi:hypothetical protein